MWASWNCYITAFRDVLGLRLPEYEAYKAWEDCAIHGGFRWMHEEFCIVSDFPEVLLVDSKNRPHCETGPSHKWRDGWSLYYWHGIKVPAWVIERKDTITVKSILDEKNTEVRRAMRNIYGNDRFMIDAGAKEVSCEPKHGARLLALHLPGDPVEIRMMELTCPSTQHKYYERVPPDVKTAMEGLSWRFGVRPSQYQPDWQT